MNTPPKKTGHPGVYRRGNSYVAIVPFKDGLGRRRQRWITRKRMREVLVARRQFLNQLDRGLRTDRGNMPIASFLQEVWLPEIARTRRTKTHNKYEAVVRNHILPAIGHIRLKDLERKQLRLLYGGLSRSVARSCHTAISSALSWAVAEEYLESNVARGGRWGHDEDRQPEVQHLDAAGSKRLLGVVKGNRLEGAVILGLVAGLREAEVCAIQWKNIDSQGVLTVTGSYWGPTKSGKIRSIPLPRNGWKRLRHFKVEQASYLLRLGVRQDDNTYVAHSILGGQTTPGALNKAFDAFARPHGFRITFHGLRHTCAILLLVSGVDVQTAAGWLGHSPATLLRNYTHYVRSAAEQAASRLDAVLS
jgi:integrase